MVLLRIGTKSNMMISTNSLTTELQLKNALIVPFDNTQEIIFE